MEQQQAWDIVEKYYPNYSQATEISLADDLQKIIDKEPSGDAQEILDELYGGDPNNPLIQADLNALLVNIYETSIMEMLTIQRGRVS